MTADTFDVICGDCGRAVTIRSVSEYHCGPRMDGYSYMMVCSCGSRVAVDGCDGDNIPASMKLDADVRWRAHRAKWRIDEERRAMRASTTKALLKNSRLDVPESHGGTTWIVYRLDDGRSISFCTDTGYYSIHGSCDSVRAFPDIEAVVANLAEADLPSDGLQSGHP